MLYILLQLRAEAATGLFNKPASVFVLDASLCLFKYLRDSICYGVIEAAMKKSGSMARLTERVRNGGEGVARGLCLCFKSFILLIYLYFFRHTAMICKLHLRPRRSPNQSR